MHLSSCRHGGASLSIQTLHVPGLQFLLLSHYLFYPVPHPQGIFLDTDGTLINSNTVPADLLAAAGYPASGRPNTTWHSAVDSEMFDPAECTYVRNRPASNDGVFCKPHLTFRSVAGVHCDACVRVCVSHRTPNMAHECVQRDRNRHVCGS